MKCPKCGHEPSPDDLPLDVLGLSARVVNALCYGMNCDTVGDVRKLDAREVVRMSNFGRASICELKACLESLSNGR